MIYGRDRSLLANERSMSCIADVSVAVSRFSLTPRVARAMHCRPISALFHVRAQLPFMRPRRCNTLSPPISRPPHGACLSDSPDSGYEHFNLYHYHTKTSAPLTNTKTLVIPSQPANHHSHKERPSTTLTITYRIRRIIRSS